MSRRDYIGGNGPVQFYDETGAFDNFIRGRGVKEARARIAVAVLATAASLARRMGQGAPVGPDAPHIANTVTFKQRGLTAKVGYIAEDFGAEPAGEHSDATIAEVALFNEYRPNNQPFMRPAAEREQSEYIHRVQQALVSMERALSLGGGR